ncbi:MAG: UDP-N-acetylmuramate dehydrogenase [Acidobacteria bacterium]|nr:UDP-N-acetylmuramate dehydrogenase [Acidobacteriota bacterium]
MSELIQENIPLAQFTTLRIGGPARYFVEAHNENQLRAALAFADQTQIPVFILGGGSNVLISDNGFPGLALRIALQGVRWFDEGKVIASAGEDWDLLVHQCVEREWAGIECLSGIPGFVGGTPVQNVGAYGQEVSETIISVRVLDRRTRRVVELSNSECGFSYRASIFNSIARQRYIVMAVTYALNPHGEPAIRYPDLKDYFAGREIKPGLKEVREAVRNIRARKAMLLTPDDPDCRSAGSFFKNPIVARDRYDQIEKSAIDHGLINPGERIPYYSAAGGQVKLPAAWLIERSGFQKGYHRGRVAISSKHSLALINRGGATAAELMALVEEIRSRVQAKFGLSLVTEPDFIGFEEGLRNKRK